MTLSLGQVTKGVTEKKTKDGQPIKAVSPVKFHRIKFVRENVKFDGENPPPVKDMILACWKKNPYATIVAMGQSGFNRKEMAHYLGYSDPSDAMFSKLYAKARTWYQNQLIGRIVKVPNDITIDVAQNGVVSPHNVSDRVKKIVVDAVFTGKIAADTIVTVSPKKLKKSGLKVKFSDLMEKLQSSAEAVLNSATEMQAKFSQAFRTRNTAPDDTLIQFSLPPALANLEAEIAAASPAETPATAG